MCGGVKPTFGQINPPSGCEHMLEYVMSCLFFFICDQIDQDMRLFSHKMSN